MAISVPNGDNIITLVFDKSNYPKEKQVIQYCKLWGCPVSKVDESENTYRVRQDKGSKYQLGSLRTVELAEGVSAVVGKKIKMTAKNPKTKKKRNSAVRMGVSNPIHFPKGKAGRSQKRGRPSHVSPTKMFGRGRKPKILWWILDLYKNDKLVGTLIGQGSKESATVEAKAMVRKGHARRAELCGPYYFKPSKEANRI